MKFKMLITVLLTSFCAAAFAQKASLEGDLSAIVGQEKVNVVFRYDDLVVGKKKGVPEAEYIKASMEEREKKSPGDGDRWLDGWTSAREKHYHPEFLRLLNDQTDKTGTEFGEFPDATHTFLVDVTMIEPGFNVAVQSRPALLNATAYLVEAGEVESFKENSKGNISIEKAPGMHMSGADFAVETRVKESFGKAGKEFGKLLRKKVY